MKARASSRWNSNRQRATSKVERTYSDAYKAAVIKGMYDFWRGQSGPANLGAFLQGEAEALATVKPAGHDLGGELAAMLRTLVKAGAAPGLEADEVGYLIRGIEETAFEASANLAGKVAETVTLGAFTPGDANAPTQSGAIDSLVQSLLPF